MEEDTLTMQTEQATAAGVDAEDDADSGEMPPPPRAPPPPLSNLELLSHAKVFDVSLTVAGLYNALRDKAGRCKLTVSEPVLRERETRHCV